MIAQQRRREIRRRLATAGFVGTRDLASELRVNVSTIRRDLDGLARAGLVLRTHGGAVLAPHPASDQLVDLPYAMKENERVAQKQAIGAFAAGLVHDGDSLVLDSGSTTFAVAQALADRRGLTVATNDLRIAHHLAAQGGVRLVVPGGQLLERVFTLVGPVTVDNLAGLHVDWAFLGADAVDLDAGVTNRNTMEVPIKQAMLGSAARAVLVADSSKFGRRAMAPVCGVDAFSHVVTDEGLDRADARLYGQRLVQVPTDV